MRSSRKNVWLVQTDWFRTGHSLPGSGTAYRAYLGIAAMRRQAAMPQFDRALELEPGNPAVHRFREDALARLKGR